MPKTVKEILEDSNFHALPEAERRKVLFRIDPKFGLLSLAEQNKVINTNPPLLRKQGQVVLEHIRNLTPNSPVIGDRDMMIKALSWVNHPEAAFARDMLKRGKTVDEISKEFQGGYDPIATTASQVARPTLEATGMAAGELAGAPLGPAMSMVGGGLGYAGGRNMADVFDYFLGLPGKPKTARQELLELPGEIATGTGITMTGPIIGKVGQKVLGPFAGKMSEEAQRLAQIAKERKLPLSPSSIFPSKTAKRFEWVSENLPPGGSLGSFVKYRQAGKLANGLQDIYDETLKGLPARLPNYEAGQTLRGAIKSAREEFAAQSRGEYAVFSKAIRDRFQTVDMSKTIQVIEDVKGGTTGKLRAVLNNAYKKGNQWLPEAVDEYQGKLKLAYKNDPHLWKKLTDALKEDIGPEMSQLLQKAKDSNKLLRNFNKIPTVKEIMRENKISPDEVIEKAFRTGNLDDITLIKNAVDKETWDIARSRFIENLLDEATDTSGQFPVFKPAAFLEKFETFGRQIKNVMPETYDSLADFALVAKAASKDIAKQNMNAIDKFFLIAKATPFMGSAAYFKNPYLIVPSGFSYVMARSLTNSPGIVRGVLKRWLTTGLLQGPMAYQGITQGTKALGVAAEE